MGPGLILQPGITVRSQPSFPVVELLLCIVLGVGVSEEDPILDLVEQ